MTPQARRGAMDLAGGGDTMLDADNDDTGSSAEKDGDQPDRTPGRHRPGPEDHIWVAALVLIVVVLFLIGLLSNLDMNNAGTTGQDWETVWR
ncbi:hypothetical protein [Streptomyces tanashiensis]|uniref:Uncharacterized protein n=1 Tax=Streptomyces tanashiensis TaxID=67367 RepID=A0ABY6R866_9ACTN|nr:hypothetical protein [Streptomyces tanashiensis]UZX26270.1 hypothetical protein LDH80_38955 [Streptomyces tanashiensis]